MRAWKAGLKINEINMLQSNFLFGMNRLLHIFCVVQPHLCRKDLYYISCLHDTWYKVCGKKWNFRGEIKMSYNNYIFIDKSEIDKPIYRIISFRRLYRIIKNKKLSLSNPRIWEDPYENFYLNCPFILDKEIVEFSGKDDIFAQCWSLKSESDALWRIYSYHKNGVRIKTTPRKLLTALNKNINSPELFCFIGKVQYKKREELIPSLGNISLINSNGSGIAESLLYKLDAFEHEKECRLIYTNCKNNKSNHFYFEIEPNDLFESLCFDPRIKHEDINRAYNRLKEHGCDIRLEYSDLYTPREKTIFSIRPIF